MVPLQDNPFADSTLYDVNTTYVPPDLNETADAVVPAITVAPAATGPAAAAQPAAAVIFPAPTASAAPAAPALQFTGKHASLADCLTRPPAASCSDGSLVDADSNLQSTVPVSGNIGRPGRLGACSTLYVGTAQHLEAHVVAVRKQLVVSFLSADTPMQT